MVVVPLSKSANDSETGPRTCGSAPRNWAQVAAGGTLIAGGLLLLTGNRRAGMVAAASGAALALLDQKDVLSAWWEMLPGKIEQAQRVLNQVQDTVDTIAAQSEKLHRVLAR